MADLPKIMGILNVTPDSFSDGGNYRSVESAVSAALRMRDEGAAIIDVGGESTRPGSFPVPLDEEIGRVLPVVEALAQRGVYVSVDTSKAEVAERSLAAGAKMINDITALGDPNMAAICSSAECAVVLMHMQGSPSTMQTSPHYGDVLREVEGFLLDRAFLAIRSGIAKNKLVIDPGIGFGKTDAHNLALIRGIATLVDTGFPVLLGVSRKGFIGRILGGVDTPAPVMERQEGTLAIQSLTQMKGVAIFRTHDVGAAIKAARMVAVLTD